MNFIDVDYDLALWITPRAYFKYLNTPWYLDQTSHLSIEHACLPHRKFIVLSLKITINEKTKRLHRIGQSVWMGIVGASKTMEKRLMYNVWYTCWSIIG